MKNSLKLEELAQFLLSIMLFSKLEYAWWWYPVLLFTPDLSMVGYLHNTATGALVYNFFHHKGLAIAVAVVGYVLQIPLLLLAGIILFGHSAMDRMLGYGLKYADDFKNTHLGRIGT